MGFYVIHARNCVCTTRCHKKKYQHHSKVNITIHSYVYRSFCLVYVVILNSACPHCDILDPQIEGKKGYVMQKLSKEQLTNDHMTLLNEGALLIVCSL